MRKLTVYLAGAVDRDTKWREYVMEQCKDVPITFLCPDESILYSPQSMAKKHKADQEFEIADLWFVEDARVIFAFYDRNSKSKYAGTSSEIGYARGLRGKHIIVVNTLTRGMSHFYEFPFRLSNRMFKSLDEGIEHLRRLAIKNNGVD